MNRELWRLAGPVGPFVTASAAVGLAVTACHVLQGWFLALTLSAILSPESNMEAFRWIGAAVVTLAVRGALTWIAELTAQNTAQRTKRYLRERLLRKLFALGPVWAAGRRSGDLQATVVTGVEALETYYSRYLPAIFVAVLGCSGTLLCVAYVDKESACLLALFVIALPTVDQLWLRWHLPRTSGVFAAMGMLNAYFLDTLQGIATLKAFDAIAGRRAELARRTLALRRESMMTLRVGLLRAGLSGLISMGGIAVVLAVDCWRTTQGELSPIALYITLFLAREAFRPLERFEREFHTAWAASSAAGPIASLLAAPTVVHEPVSPARAPSRSTITFENVSFSYASAESPALSAVSFAIHEHERVALVGASGAGKSTIIALLLRFFDPQAGAVRIGDADIKLLRLADLRSRVSVVSQDTVLFHGTIEDNLRFARCDATAQDIRAAAKAAHIDEFIQSLPLGYDTQVGERGSQLSGGQRQRIAIARALLKDAPILVLDEATSSVDSAVEQAIQAALTNLAQQRTSIVIAHRFATIRSVDRIFVLERGSLVEVGTHAELSARRGLYSGLSFSEGVL